MEKCDNHNSLPNNYFELKENIENNIINKHIIVPLFVIWWNEEECVYYFTQKQISNIVSLSDNSLREGRLLSSLEWKFNDMDTNKQMIHWSHEQKTLFFHNYYKELDKVLYEAVEEVIAPYLEYIKQLSNSWTST